MEALWNLPMHRWIQYTAYRVGGSTGIVNIGEKDRSSSDTSGRDPHFYLVYELRDIALIDRHESVLVP